MCTKYDMLHLQIAGDFIIYTSYGPSRRINIEFHLVFRSDGMPWNPFAIIKTAHRALFLYAFNFDSFKVKNQFSFMANNHYSGLYIYHNTHYPPRRCQNLLLSLLFGECSIEQYVWIDNVNSADVAMIFDSPCVANDRKLLHRMHPYFAKWCEQNPINVQLITEQYLKLTLLIKPFNFVWEMPKCANNYYVSCIFIFFHLKRERKFRARA